MSACNEMGERQHVPSLAPGAVGGELVFVLEQSGEGAEVDHARA